MRGNHHPPNGTTLSVWQVVELARHSLRPYSHDYLRRLVPDFVELHGDRLSADDPALIAGVGTWHGRTTMFFGHQKGRSLKEQVSRNWGMMHPEGYRKAIRLAHHAAKFGFPIVSLIDTPGAYPGAAAEDRGIAAAIASAIREWFEIPVPIVAAVIGEGGSGGALGMGVADRVIMLENSIYSVASPEAAASDGSRSARDGCRGGNSARARRRCPCRLRRRFGCARRGPVPAPAAAAGAAGRRFAAAPLRAFSLHRLAYSCRAAFRPENRLRCG